MQRPPQSTRPDWQVRPQLPPEHTRPLPQALPQAPQLSLSVAVSTQVPEQSTDFPVQGEIEDLHPEPARSHAPTANHRAKRATGDPLLQAEMRAGDAKGDSSEHLALEREGHIPRAGDPSRSGDPVHGAAAFSHSGSTLRTSGSPLRAGGDWTRRGAAGREGAPLGSTGVRPPQGKE